ncbi:MAG: ABC transporter permease, partial [Geminicoccus sp.]|nr:ABC transporter permease [Geminicoccus sp.]
MNFLRVTITRLAYAALLLVAVLILNFTLMHLAPGDVADTI